MVKAVEIEDGERTAWEITKEFLHGFTNDMGENEQRAAGEVVGKYMDSLDAINALVKKLDFKGVDEKPENQDIMTAINTVRQGALKKAENNFKNQLKSPDKEIGL